jgi:DMSO reductase family type II enzyme molybdopterin subunit
MSRLSLGLHALVAPGGSIRSVREALLAASRAAPEWERVTRVTCRVNCAYQRLCSHNAYVTDGVVLRVEQTGAYPEHGDGRPPDRNPRGCQKGMVYAHRNLDPARIKYPMRRVGERGEGKWRRISWEEALSEIADAVIDVLTTEGTEAIVLGGGTQGEGSGVSDVLSGQALWSHLGVPMTDVNVEIGDDHQGATATFGTPFVCDSADNWYYADMILVWGGNPAYTNIPNFHYITEARYNGTQVVAICPDLSPSAIRADRWVPVNIGTDAALALSMANVIIAEGLYNEAFVREQTDLPLLVRDDTRKFLRERDLKRGGSDDVLYIYDPGSREVVEAPRKSLALNGLVPALEGEFTVETLDGRVTVRPMLELLKRHLAAYTPERASQITGCSPETIARLARDVARAKGVVNITTYNWGKFYHGDLIERAIILIFALCGHMGRKGASYNAFSSFFPDTSFGPVLQLGSQVLQASAASDPRYARWREEGYTDEMVLYEYVREAYQRRVFVGTSMFYYFHGGLLDLSEKHNSWDPHLKRPLREYTQEALAKGWALVAPLPGKDPRILFNMGGNFARRVRGTQEVLRTLLPKLRLLVCIDFRMTSTAMLADIVLPAAGWYEKHSICFLHVTHSPYLHVCNKAMEPLWESKSEWEIWCLLAETIQRRAQERGIHTYKDASGNEKRLDNIYDRVTMNGFYSAEDDEAAARDTFLNTKNVEPMDWAEFKERGFAAFTGVGMHVASVGNSCDLVPGEPMVPLTWHTDRKDPYPTATRRMQFYIDHDWHLELGEQFPVQKQDPKAGGDYPLRVTGGHARWSVQSTHVDNALLLRLQRGGPVLYLSVADARARGVKDGEMVDVFNDVGAFQTRAVVAPSVRPGQVIIYHAWENLQFPGWRHFKSVMPSPLNPIEMASGYFQFRPIFFTGYPGHSDRDSRVEVRLASRG